MAAQSEPTKTLVACTNCGKAFVARKMDDDTFVAFGKNGCDCGTAELKQLS